MSELQAFSFGTNVASNGTARHLKQRRYDWDTRAYLAIDGDIDTFSMTETRSGVPSKWGLYLKQDYEIGEVVILIKGHVVKYCPAKITLNDSQGKALAEKTFGADDCSKITAGVFLDAKLTATFRC